ncbi:Uncharacterised protein [Bacillus freudenreichii]|nr:Uncharacterised protein [Bacillus freudenreichii]
MYNSPVLYDNSETIKEQFSVNTARPKHLIIYDQEGADDVKQFVTNIQQETLEYDLYEMTDSMDLNELRVLLYQQKMGTQLYLASKWDNAVIAFTEAIEAGFTEDEIQTVIYGEKRRYAYCMKCYNVTEIGEEDKDQCTHCGTHILVGPFFSHVRKGYVTYPYAVEKVDPEDLANRKSNSGTTVEELKTI